MPVVAENKEVIERLRNLESEDAAFMLLAGNTAISRVPGISAAGGSPEITSLTPVVDSEIILDGKCYSMSEPPMTPEGIPTPALITRTSLSIANMGSFVIDAGLSMSPRVPYIHSGLGPAGNPAESTALPEYENAFAFGKYVGRAISSRYGAVFIAESVPGGTTTSYMTLRSLGYSFETSSSLPSDPSSMKEELWNAALARTGSKPFGAARSVMEFGDYMMPVALGMLSEMDKTTAFLSGGTQMATVYRLAELLGIRTEKYLITTRWVTEHRKETIYGLVPGKRVIVSHINLSGSRHNGLRMYEDGHVREGAGMGGAFAIASSRSEDEQDLYRKIDSTYDCFL